tara:strand:+ start:176 stop:1261 length:1086 start_codon:yes stop_codon:yes gene_type:complete
MKQINVGSDFSGVGAFDQALIRLKIKYNTVFACDMDKYARQTYIENYGEPKNYPNDVYNREIPKKSLDIYMTSPPCQAFSMAGKRLGKEDKRGILFFNSHEFIKKNKPRYFIFENVKGLLSHENGKTFQEWLNYLGGKSINGLPVLFADENAVSYHIYYKVLNAKKLNVPQNRERIFIIGIRDDQDNYFRWPKDEHLSKKLKDVLENEVNEKYFLNQKAIQGIMNSKFISKSTIIQNKNNYCATLLSRDYKDPKCIKVELKMWIADYRNDEGLRIRKDNISPCMTSSMRGSKEYNPKAGTRNPPIIGNDKQIRRLTPRECFRLMDFPDSFKWPVSDSQAYKQAGNSIVVKCLEKIIEKFNL